MPYSKEKLRHMIREKRKNLNEKFVNKNSMKIQKKVLEKINENQKIFSYLSQNKEVKTYWLVEKLISQNFKISVPLLSNKTMEPAEINSLKNMKKNNFGIEVPQKSNIIDKKNIDIVIAPGLAFDKQGNRVGYGKGYYDRFLSDFEGDKIGLAFDFQLVEEIQTDKWDIPMDMIITNERTLNLI